MKKKKIIQKNNPGIRLNSLMAFDLGELERMEFSIEPKPITEHLVIDGANHHHFETDTTARKFAKKRGLTYIRKEYFEEQERYNYFGACCVASRCLKKGSLSVMDVNQDNPKKPEPQKSLDQLRKEYDTWSNEHYLDRSDNICHELMDALEKYESRLNELEGKLLKRIAETYLKDYASTKDQLQDANYLIKEGAPTKFRR